VLIAILYLLKERSPNRPARVQARGGSKWGKEGNLRKAFIRAEDSFDGTTFAA
jgi:hypothetical protein